jgi:transcriptional regulator with XRE-family HTH domain
MVGRENDNEQSLSHSFGSLLKELRESRGLSQSELGRRCGMSHATISRLESGGRMPSRTMVSRLARAMSLSHAEAGRLFAVAGFWPTVAVNGRQSLIATLSRILEDRKLDEATRDQAAQKVGELVAWLDGQLGKEKSG